VSAASPLSPFCRAAFPDPPKGVGLWENNYV
jgi:hypothetical protein